MYYVAAYVMWDLRPFPMKGPSFAPVGTILPLLNMQCMSILTSGLRRKGGGKERKLMSSAVDMVTTPLFWDEMRCPLKS